MGTSALVISACAPSVPTHKGQPVFQFPRKSTKKGGVASDEEGDVAREPGVQRLEFQTRQDNSEPPRMVASLCFFIGRHLKNPLCPVTDMNPKVDIFFFLKI